MTASGAEQQKYSKGAGGGGGGGAGRIRSDNYWIWSTSPFVRHMSRQITWCACQRETAGDPYSWRRSGGQADPVQMHQPGRGRASDALGGEGGEGRGNTGVIDFWCLYFMLEIGRYIQPVWSMRAVVLRKNLSKCVISPLMEHGRRAILLIPSRSLPAPGRSLPLFPPSPPSASCSLMSPFHYRPSIYQPLYPSPTQPPVFFFFVSRSDFAHTPFWTGATVIAVLPHGHHQRASLTWL